MGSDTTFSAADVDTSTGASRAEKLLSDPRRLSRLRWRCRRGMLENDLVLERFMTLRGDALTEDEVFMLDRLLDLPDNELWDLIAGRAEPTDPSVAPLVAALVATEAATEVATEAATDPTLPTKERR